MAGMRGKCDPSRGGGRGRRVDGRGGRDVLPDCADDGRWRPEQTGADRPTGTAACSRHDRGHTPRRRRRDGCTDGRLSGGGASPRRRSARGDLRLDNGPEPWHNSSDRLGLSELGAVTRVRLGYNRTLTPRLSPLPTLPERSAGGQRRGRGRRRSPWTQRARPQGAWKTAKNAVSHSAHSNGPPELPSHGRLHRPADAVRGLRESGPGGALRRPPPRRLGAALRAMRRGCGWPVDSGSLTPSTGGRRPSTVRPLAGDPSDAAALTLHGSGVSVLRTTPVDSYAPYLPLSGDWEVACHRFGYRLTRGTDWTRWPV